jgi:two-component system LytT family sensor kinase
VHPANDKLILITLLVELGVAAAVASSLARSVAFKRLLLEPHRGWRDSAKLILMVCIPLMLGVWVRVRVPNFLAADLSYEATVLLALLMGTRASLAGGTLLALPALLHGEFMALPANLVVALLFGTLHRWLRAEEVWSFSPLIDLSVYRWVRGKVLHPQLDRQMALLAIIMAVQLLSSELTHFYPRRFFDLYSPSWELQFLICASAPVVVGIPLKIWNTLRLDRKLEEQTRLLMEARFEALQRQINPHFLFNTLNSIASLIRSRPELARAMIVKLANILRVLLKDRDAFVPLGEELAFTDDYLDIEVIRFGDKLRVVKDIAENTLDLAVPSMMLQPLIENSIKHGLEPRISGGTVTLRSRLQGNLLVLEVEDDGVGVDPLRPRVPETERGGIGMRNVRERMQVLYGEDAVVEMESRPGRGTRVRLVMPQAVEMNVRMP